MRSQNPYPSHNKSQRAIPVKPKDSYNNVNNSYHSGIFQTQPNMYYADYRSESVSPRNVYQNYSMVSPRSNSHSNYPRSLPRQYQTEEYKNPPTRLDDGLYKKLYTGGSKEALSAQLKSTSNLKPYLANGNKQSPFYVGKDEVSLFDDAKFKNFMRSYQPETKTNNIFPQTPDRKVQFQQPNYPLPSAQREQTFSRSSMAMNSSNVAKQQAKSNFAENNSFMHNTSAVNTASTDASPKTIENTSRDWEPSPKYHVADEIISPSGSKPRAAFLPRMEDSKKMRNPIFSSHDFSNFEDSPSMKKSYVSNSSHLGPVSPKAYLNSQKVTLAQIGSDNPPVNHSFKIDHAYGVIPITSEEKKSIANNALKTFLSNEPRKELYSSNSDYLKVQSSRPTSLAKLHEQSSAYQSSTERINPGTLNQTSILIKDEAGPRKADYGAFEKSVFAREAVSLNNSPLVKGGLTGKGHRGYGICSPTIFSGAKISPPW